jgi:hypothetical protein
VGASVFVGVDVNACVDDVREAVKEGSGTGVGDLPEQETRTGNSVKRTRYFAKILFMVALPVKLYNEKMERVFPRNQKSSR